MSERMEFITKLRSGERMTDLCESYGISRKTGYKLLERFNRLGPIGLYDVSRRPHRLARLTVEPVRELLIEARRAHATWGPRKIRAWLSDRHSGVKLPSSSAIGDLYKREGLVQPRRRKARVSPYGERLSESSQPNDVWCVDFKGQFRLGNGNYCYPLTVTDHFSRYLLGCVGFEQIQGETATIVFEELFATNGLPTVIRSDNGPPFASRGLLGLSRLSVFWLKHGIKAERIEPAHPEQNGRHERMHRTLKAETTRPAGATLLAQQERFDLFSKEYNETRPHEALGQRPPAEIYQPSSRAFSAERKLEYPLHDDIRTVDASGHVNLLRRQGGSFHLSSALAGERIGVRELDNGHLLVTFAHLDLGSFDPATMRFFPAECVSGPLMESMGNPAANITQPEREEGTCLQPA